MHAVAMSVDVRHPGLKGQSVLNTSKSIDWLQRYRVADLCLWTESVKLSDPEHVPERSNRLVDR